MAVLEELLEPDTAGDPMGKKRKWSRRSTRSVSEDLATRGLALCPNSVGKMLQAGGFSLRPGSVLPLISWPIRIDGS